MSLLPRPIKTVLAEPPQVDASVMRVWAKVQLQRRVPPPVIRPPFIVAGLVAMAAFVVMVWPMTRVVVAPIVAAAPLSPVEAPRLGWRSPMLVSTLHARRPSISGPARPFAASQVPLEAEPPTDVVGALLMGVEDAARQSRTEQVVALLGEVGTHHGDDPRAAEALFMLGSIQLDVLKQPGLALNSFRHALELRPPDDLVPQLWERYETARVASER